MLHLRPLQAALGLLMAGAFSAACGTGESTETNEADLGLPPAYRVEWVQIVRQTVDVLDAELGIAAAHPVDRAKLSAELEAEVLTGPESFATIAGAFRKATLAYPSGHLSFWMNKGVCQAEGVALQSASRIGVCAQPYRDHAVVSNADPGALLAVGDEILAVDGKRGEEMMQAALEQPMCGSSSASESNRRFIAATSLFGAARVGTTIEVKHLDGTIETKRVASLAPTLRSCRTPFGDGSDFVAKATMRGDVGIIRSPSFSPTPIGSGESPEAQQARVERELLAAFQQVKGARAIVWDIRANAGGWTTAALKAIAGFPGARAGTPIDGLKGRIANTSFFYDQVQTWPLEAPGAFAYDGKVAVLTDGLSVSAADYFARAAKIATSAILVGSGTAGGFGGTREQRTIGGSYQVTLGIDPWVGFSTSGEQLEGVGTLPHISSELEPADLARGVDTTLEAAIAALR